MGEKVTGLPVFDYLARQPELAVRFGENALMIIGCLIMAASLFAIPYIGPEVGGLLALLAVTAMLAVGNSMASPAVTSLVSKISEETQQGKALGVMQSGASLARAIGPALGGVLLNNSTITRKTG